MSKYEHTWGNKVTQIAYDPTPIELLDRIIDLIDEVDGQLAFENLLGHAREYIELTIFELKKRGK